MKSNLGPETSLAEGFELQSGKYILNEFSCKVVIGITYLAEHTMLDVQVLVKDFFPIFFLR